jgi:hypothetical protein
MSGNSAYLFLATACLAPFTVTAPFEAGILVAGFLCLPFRIGSVMGVAGGLMVERKVTESVGHR